MLSVLFVRELFSQLGSLHFPLFYHYQFLSTKCQSVPFNAELHNHGFYIAEEKSLSLPCHPDFNCPVEEGFRKHCGKRRKCWLPAFSPFPAVFSTLSNSEKSAFYQYLIYHMQKLPFPTVFSKDVYCRQEKTKACLGKG